jgi:hypothetical protein
MMRAEGSMLRFTATLALVAVCLGLAGCPSSTTAMTEIPVEDLGAHYATTTCGAVTDCYGDTVRALFLGLATETDCVTQFTNGYQDGALPLYQQAIAAGTLRYDAANAQACIDALEALGCGFTTSRTPAACDALLVGLVANGGACSINEECAGDAYCANATTCPGTCQPRVGAGAACPDDEACTTGLRCGSAHTCVAPALEGAPCQGSTGTDCAGGVICIGSSGTTAGVCRTPETVFSGALHGACNVPAGQFCTSGLSCVVAGITSMSCEVGGIAIGQACHTALPDACAPGAFCGDTNVNTQDFDGTCMALPSAGAACAMVPFGPSCAPGLHCDAGTCRETHVIGGSCTTNGECFSGHCAGTVCAANTLCGR